ncbi:hypothetical protein BHM03_00018897 [Ensete ventricosum]|nr:hypothetical protein BHM03_00018897 [Ensete ventricosum]
MMRLGTRLEYIGSSPRVSGVYQDGAREFAGRRPRLVERLSGVAKKLAGSSNDEVGAHREFAEGIGKLARNMPRDHRRKTVRLTARMAKAADWWDYWQLDHLRPVVEPPVPYFQGTFDGCTASVGGCTARI